MCTCKTDRIGWMCACVHVCVCVVCACMCDCMQMCDCVCMHKPVVHLHVLKLAASEGSVQVATGIGTRPKSSCENG